MAVATLGSLNTLLRKHDQNILRNHQCFECGKAFANKGSLKMHLKVHTDELPHQCSVCLKRFKFPISKHQHKCEGSPRVHAAPRNLYYTNNLDVDHAYWKSKEWSSIIDNILISQAYPEDNLFPYCIFWFNYFICYLIYDFNLV